jgi:hypothetical protein
MLISVMTAPEDSELRTADATEQALEFFGIVTGWLDRARRAGAIRHLNIRQAIPNVIGLVLFYPAVGTDLGDLVGRECLDASKSSLAIKNDANDVKHRLRWKWAKGAATDIDEFANPVGGSAIYRVCIYDGSANTQPMVEMDVPPGGTCGGVPCWKAVHDSGFRYKNKAGTPDGIAVMKLKAPAPAATDVARDRAAGHRRRVHAAVLAVDVRHREQE